MAQIIHSIFALVPWLKTFLAWAIGISVVIAVISVPAYFLFLPITRRLRSGISEYLASIKERHNGNAADRLERQRNLIARLSEDRLLRHIDSSSERLWSRTQATLLHSIEGIKGGLLGVTSRVDEFTKALPKLHEGLGVIANSIPKDLNVPTTSEAVTQAVGSLRVARMALVSAFLLLIAIITVNTGMLSQIVRDLGFIPPSLKFIGFQLYYVLALLITCVEAGLGLVHGVLSDSGLRDEHIKIRIGAILASIAAVGIACVEGFFYSRIVPTRTETVTIPLIGYTLPQTDIFFIWGFLLVMTLFSLGMIVYRMSALVLRGTALSAVKKQLRNLAKESFECSAALKRAETLSASAIRAISAEDNPGASKPFASEAVERLVSEIQSLTNTRPEWTKIVEQPLGVSEVLHLSGYALLWSGLAAVAVVLVCLSGVASFTTLRVVTMPSLFALAQAVFVATAGFMAARDETVVQGIAWQKVTAPMWGRVIGMILLGAFVTSDLFFIVITYPTGIVFWVGNLLTCLVLAAACYQLMPLVTLLEVWTQRSWQFAISTSERAYHLVIAAMLVVVALVDQVVRMLASPISVFTGRRLKSVPQAITTYANDRP